MNPQELRIGNLVHVDNLISHPQLEGVAMEVTSIQQHTASINPRSYEYGVGLLRTDDTHYKKDYAQFMKFIKPILITEDWLLEFGFKKDKIDSTFYKGDFEIYLPNFMRWKGSLLPVLRYVHQLQNLHFGLTGKELELKFKTN